MATVYWSSFDSSRPEAERPNRSHAGDAGMDLYTSEDVIVTNAVTEVPTNLCIAMPDDIFAMIVPRSSTLHKLGIHVVTGIIDSGYRGELFVQALSVNRDSRVRVSAGQRIAQLLFLPVVRVELVHTRTPLSPPRDNRVGGFGSTGA